MKKLLGFLCALVLLFGTVGPAGAAPVYLNGVTSGAGWTDADGTGDLYMCWAAAAANALYFTGWNGGFASADAILNYYKSRWSDGTGNAFYGVEWFFDGVETNVPGSGTTANKADGGNFYSFQNFDNNVGAYSSPDFEAVKTWVDRSYDPSAQYYGGSYGIMAHMAGGGGHYINIWGYDVSTQTVWITDNNTAFLGLEERTFASLGIDNLERLSENGWDGNYIEPNPSNGNGGNPVPEPATMILLGSGLIGLAFGRRSIRKV